MLNRKRSALSLALAVALTPLMASAQTAEPSTTTARTGTAATNLDTVQVTGIRRGIENAIAIKQDPPRWSKRSRPKTSANCPT